MLPALSEHLTDDALARAGGGTAADLREAQETAALAKRLNPFAVEPVFAQAAIAERGNQPAAAAGLLVEAVERQPSNPSAWTRLARFQLAVGDSRGALRSILTAASLDRRGSPRSCCPSRRSTTRTAPPPPPARRCPSGSGPAPADSRAPGGRPAEPLARDAAADARRARTHPRPAGTHARTGSAPGAAARQPARARRTRASRSGPRAEPQLHGVAWVHGGPCTHLDQITVPGRCGGGM